VADDRRGTVGVTATARVTQVPRGIALALQLIVCYRERQSGRSLVYERVCYWVKLAYVQFSHTQN
jgi:hypothetical protein